MRAMESEKNTIVQVLEVLANVTKNGKLLWRESADNQYIAQFPESPKLVVLSKRWEMVPIQIHSEEPFSPFDTWKSIGKIQRRPTERVEVFGLSLRTWDELEKQPIGEPLMRFDSSQLTIEEASILEALWYDVVHLVHVPKNAAEELLSELAPLQ